MSVSMKTFIIVAALLVTGVGGCRKVFDCGDEVVDKIGHFSSKESGMRASIKKLSQQIRECPKRLDT